MAGNDFGIMGMAVMGQNLALNAESKGFSVSVYNRTTSTMEEFVEERCEGRDVSGYRTVEDFVESLQRPRRIMILVKAGPAVDKVIEQLLPHVDEGDVIIDGGNSYFKDTIRRTDQLEDKGLLFIGTGVSGGEEGALKGPSLMPGGSERAYSLVEPIFTKIAAQVDGDPCCTYLGDDGAGHYVKMVHNGIEYADMQLIAEAYSMMESTGGLDTDELHEVFSEWNRGELDSYLVEITADIFSTTDPETGRPMVDVILDKAKQKGTGKWTSQSALDLGIPAPSIAEAVFARCISGQKEQRVAASDQLRGPDAPSPDIDLERFVDDIRQALYASKVCAYAQGFALMKQAAEDYGWSLNPGEIAMIWRGGCIIRAQFLNRIKAAYERNPDLANLLLDPFFKKAVEEGQDAWRRVVQMATEQGIPTPAFSSSLAYYDSYRSKRLPANLIQAQRDYFGAHTYERVDRDGRFHTEWLKM
ncbi:MAG: decarboxylating NADP(+)-dependent phosphogluconate dehydrogenase [Planctomycetota bacterium]